MSIIRNLLLILVLLLTATTAIAEEIEEFTLYSGTPKDPYTLYFPIELKEPGQIKATARILSSKPQLGDRDFMMLFLADSRAFGKVSPTGWKKWVNKANKYNPVEHLAGDELRGFVRGMKSMKDSLLGKKKKRRIKMPKYFHRGAKYRERGATLQYNVDAPALAATGGRFVLIVKNISNKEVQKQLTISYPGAKVANPRASLPDLVVKALWLNPAKKVVVLIKNMGAKGLTGDVYARKGKAAVSLMLQRNGQGWGGATLPGIDPGRHLMNPKACVVYTSNLTINQLTRVTATIDPNRQLAERNRRNNSLTRELGH
ncbi:MAG: hypothetical protein GY697_10920 [Desulfobacterales bacterium]|nr:hypothetical protein [Desulfobacterales bacterium]